MNVAQGNLTMIRLFCLILLWAALARPDVIVTSTVLQRASEYTYAYSVDNKTSHAIVGFSVTAAGPVDQVFDPSGWTSGTVALTSETLVQWIATDMESYINSGQSLSEFAIDSAGQPGQGQFTAIDDSSSFIQGQTTGPLPASSTTPEPATVLFVALGLTLVFGLQSAVKTMRC